MTTPEPALQAYLAACRERVDAALAQWLPNAELPPQNLHAAMRYAALGDGKRIRPVLVYGAGAALGVEPARLDGPACAVELIHAYSLVHDDLPAMDDDDLRRGRPTCHRAFDEATAILAGDALQTLAFQILARAPQSSLDPAARLAMLETLARASGSRGMAGGQALDIAAVGRQLDLAQLENLHIHKTGALIRASVRLGTLAAAQAAAAQTKALDHYAKCIGLAFQVQDDILDVAGDTATLGKTGGKDAAADKPTYPALLGLEGARRKAAELLQDALDSLAGFGSEAQPLRQLARYIVGRAH
jgi:farnesyl diphosphate synthase